MKDCFFALRGSFFFFSSYYSVIAKIFCEKRLVKITFCRRRQEIGVRNRWTLFPTLALAPRALAQLPR